MKVKVKTTISPAMKASRHAGDVIEVEDSRNSRGTYTVKGETYGVREEDFEILRDGKIKVKITDKVIPQVVAYHYKGQILEVADAGNGYWSAYSKMHGVFTIDKDYTEIMTNTFEPKSGQVFKTNDGRYGLFVDVAGELKMLYQDKNSQKFNLWGDYDSRKLTNPADTFATVIMEVFEGMHDSPANGLNHNLANDEVGKQVWARKPSNRVELTREKTGLINVERGTVTVGCTTIPMEKVRELVARYDELKS